MKTLAFAFLMLVLSAGGAQAVTVEGAEFPKTVALGDRVLDLAGTATYRVVFTVCAAALYVPAGTARGEVLSGATPWQLTIEYFHDIDRKSLIKAANEVLARVSLIPPGRWP